ncbi:hypothetical protein [Alteromonas sp. 14N.309.X.WAT.G.H12]|uniref:hypothetical protein n=1 Tax=Alteromonas sp. 14N.309.X.WAT.G.H12 TaxID=3120824 RepID=UPI002FD17142
MINYCHNEPNDELRMSCVVNAAFFLEEFESAFNGGERELITICGNLTVTAKEPGERMYHLMRCVAEQHVLEESHPHPKYARIMLRKKEFRPYWVSRCSDHKDKISACVKGQEASMQTFWQFYLSTMDESPNALVFKKMDACIGDTDIRKINFTSLKSCIGF